MKWLGSIAILWLGLLLIGCQPVSDSVQPIQTDQILLKTGESVGQSLVAHFNGLAAIGFRLTPTGQTQGVLEFELKDFPKGQVLRRVELPVASLASPDQEDGAPIYFYFQPLIKSANASYYTSIKFSGNGQVSVGRAEGDSYLNGAAYHNSLPLDEQTTFTLLYAPKILLRGLLHEAVDWIQWTLLAILLFIIPGWGMLCWLYPGWSRLAFWEKLGLAGGLSLCVYPLLLLWSNLLGLSLGKLNAVLPVCLGLLSVCIHSYQGFRQWKSFDIRLLRVDWPGITMLGGLSLALAARLWVIRNLDLPLWGDSLQHTMVVQLIVDNAGLFHNWQPYTDLISFTYHFGFHSQAAAFHWLSQASKIATSATAPGTMVAHSVLITGQLINFLAVLALYPLSMRLTHSRWAATAAVILGGLIFAMPMYYVNWGRYTQLAALAILPIAAAQSIAAIENDRPPISLFILTWIAWAGLALTHYRVLIFGWLFIIAYLTIAAWQIYHRQRELLPQKILTTLVIFFGALLLAAPWLIRLFASGSWLPFFQQISLPASQMPAHLRQAETFSDLSLYLPVWAWILLPAVTAIGLWKRRQAFAVISLWALLVLFVARPGWLGLPGTGLMTTFAVVISAYLPASILLGAGYGLFSDACLAQVVNIPLKYPKKMMVEKQFVSFLLAIVLLAAAGISTSTRLSNLSTDNALATRPDIAAAIWIQAHLPADARLLVNSSFAYGGSAVVGTDGGWWLPILAMRSTTQPPLSYLAEIGPRPDYTAWVNALPAKIIARGIADPAVITELKNLGVDYIYVGQRRGLVNSPQPLIQLDQIAQNPIFKEIYAQDRVRIYQILENSTP